jgi:hypothetical protein
VHIDDEGRGDSISLRLGHRGIVITYKVRMHAKGRARQERGGRSIGVTCPPYRCLLPPSFLPSLTHTTTNR